MDPDATLHDLLDALDETDWDAVCELSQALLTWLQHKGFPPVTLGSPSLGDDWHRMLTRCVCQTALLRAEAARKSPRTTSDSA